MAWDREKARAYQREWARKRRQDPEYKKIGARKTREWQKKNPEKNAWSQYQTSARKRGYEFLLSKEEFESLIAGNCHYCNQHPNPVNGVDRYENAIGYVPGNCVPCCVMCNRAKGTYTVEEFNEWVVRTYKNLMRK